MDSDIVGSILLQVVLIAVNAVFACAEIAVVSCNDAKLEKMAQEGNKRAAKLFHLTEQPSRFLATIQVVITLSGFLGSAFAAENFSDRIVSALVDAGMKIPEKTLDAIAVVLITLLLSYITLIFGELVPKRIAMQKAEQIALGISGLVSGASKVFAPLVWLLTASTNGILRLLGIDPDEDDDQVTEEEIRMMVDAGSEKGAIDNEEKDMIQNVFEFDDLTIDEICVHRTDVDLLWLEDSMEEWEQLIHESRHSYYPVCGETVDDIIGVLDAKDYFRLRTKDRDHVMKEAIKQAKKAYAIGEVPIGCVIVYQDKIIGRGYNRRTIDNNTLAHAELAAIRKASRKMNDWRLEDCTMYVTLEPCQMCSGAIVQSRMTRVVVGCMNPKAGCAGSILNLLDMPEFNHQVELTTGVMEEECSQMMKSFFKELREARKKKKQLEKEQTEEI